MNMTNETIENTIAEYLKVLGSAFRLQILFSIGFGESCVCHLEAILKKRQAYISQHLMVLRDAGILNTRRDGKYIYYRVADKDIFGFIQTAAETLNISRDQIPEISNGEQIIQCECPKCQSGS